MVVTWSDGERCVVAQAGVAGGRWLELADVVVCPPVTAWYLARRRALAVADSLPGCTVVAAASEDRCCFVLRGVFVLRMPLQVCTAATAVWCYASLCRWR